MTEQEWDELEESIDQYHNENLVIDGFKITLRIVHVGKLDLAIAVYVNGKIKGAWSNPDNPAEEARRFWFKSTRKLHSKKQFKTMKKVLDLKEEDNEIHFYKPYFRSFRTLKRTFKRNNEKIEWQKTETTNP